MADLRVVSVLVAVAGCFILFQVQAVNYIIGNTTFQILLGGICSTNGTTPKFN